WRPASPGPAAAATLGQAFGGTAMSAGDMEIGSVSSKAAALLVAVGAFIVAGHAAAHHSFAAEFDANSPIELTGVVTKVEWMNPHTFFYIDVEGENGEYQNWALELGSPNGLMRRGWTRDSLKVGDVVTVS